MSNRQEQVVLKTKRPITKKDIVKGLRTLGLKADSKVEVHTSLASFGYIINKEYDIIDALLEVVSKGVVMMPAHTSENTDPTYWENPPVPKDWIPIIKEHQKPFDKKVFVPQRVGRTPVAFLLYPGVERTNHPIDSLAIYNQTDDSSWLDHSLNQDDDVHPLFKLANEGGKILFLGTNFQTCTSIHLTEKFSDTLEVREDTVPIIEDGETVHKTYRYYEFDGELDHFEEIANAYIAEYDGTPYYRQVKIGLATCTLIDAEALFDIGYDFHKKLKK